MLQSILQILPQAKQDYNTIQNCNCKTNNIIYCITCTICFKQYIGHTKRTLGERMWAFSLYSGHYNTDDHSGLSNVCLHVLQFGRNDPDSKESLRVRLKLEQLWIHNLWAWTYLTDQSNVGAIHIYPSEVQNLFAPVLIFFIFTQWLYHWARPTKTWALIHFFPDQC